MLLTVARSFQLQIHQNQPQFGPECWYILCGTSGTPLKKKKKKKTGTGGLGLEQVLLNMVRESFPGRINTTGVGGFPKRRRNLSFLMLTSNNMFLGVSNGKIKI